MFLSNSFSGGTDGGTLTAANSGGASGDAFSSVTGTGSTYTSTHATGDHAPLVASTTGSGSSLFWNSLTISGRTVYGRLYVYLTAYPGSADTLGSVQYSFGNDNARIRINTTGTVFIADTAGTAVPGMTTTNPIPLNQWVRIEYQIVVGTTTSNGVCELRVYHNADSSSATDTKSATGRNFNTSAPTGVVFRLINSSYYLDDIAASDTDWIGGTALNAEATPDTVNGATTVPAPGLSSGQSFTLAQVTGAADIPAPVISYGATVSLTTVTATAAVRTPSVTEGDVELVALDTVTASTTVPDPTLSAGQSKALTTVTGAAALPGPSISADSSATITPATVAGTTRIPLVIITVPFQVGSLITADGQIEWAEAVWGGGPTYRVIDLQGWEDLPGIDSGNELRPARHGAWAGRKLAQERIVSAVIMIDDNSDSFATSLRTLRRAMAIQEGSDEGPLVIRLRGETLLANAAVISRIIPNDLVGAGIVKAAVRWACADPRRYSLTLHSATISANSNATIVNDGDTASHPLIRITGPAQTPRLVNSTLDRILQFDIQLENGERLDIDTNEGTVRIGVTNQMRTLSSSSVPVEDFVLGAGDNAISYTVTSGSGLCDVLWRDAYL